MGKKALCLIFAFLLSIESMAAVVSDNDGSAFVTKAEFELLKQDFSNQILNYNNSIDGKIDGAIASYLAGLKFTAEPINYWEKVQEATNKGIWWQNAVDIGDEELTQQVSLGVTREIYQAHRRPAAYGWWHGAASQLRHFVNATTGNGSDIKYADMNNWGSYMRTDTQGPTSWTGSYGNIPPIEYMTIYNTGSNSEAGSGKRWEVHRNPSGLMLLRTFNNKYFPVLLFMVWNHVYFNNTTDSLKSSFEDGGRSYKTAGSGTAPILTTWGKKSTGTKYTGTSTNTGNYIELTAGLNKVNDGINYEVRLFSPNIVNTQIVYSLDDAKPYQDTSVADKTLSVDTVEFYDLWHGPRSENLQTNEIYGYTLTYHTYNITYTKDYIKNFYNEYVSAATNETVYLGQGCKIIENESAEESEIKIKAKLITNTGSGLIRYVVCDRQFNKDGGYESGSLVQTNTINAGETFEINRYLLKSKAKLFINLEALDANTLATIDSLDITMN